jgi:hypothetical protein
MYLFRRKLFIFTFLLLAILYVLNVANDRFLITLKQYPIKKSFTNNEMMIDDDQLKTTRNTEKEETANKSLLLNILPSESDIKQINKSDRALFDRYCDAYGEWAYINRTVYIHKRGVFYFKDAQLLKFRLLKESNINHRFLIALYVYSIHDSNKELKKVFNLSEENNSHDYDFKIRIDSNHLTYNSTVLEARIRPQDLLLNSDNSNSDDDGEDEGEKIKIELLMTDLVSGEAMSSLINVNIKNLRGENKKVIYDHFCDFL